MLGQHCHRALSEEKGKIMVVSIATEEAPDTASASPKLSKGAGIIMLGGEAGHGRQVILQLVSDRLCNLVDGCISDGAGVSSIGRSPVQGKLWQQVPPLHVTDAIKGRSKSPCSLAPAMSKGLPGRK